MSVILIFSISTTKFTTDRLQGTFAVPGGSIRPAKHAHLSEKRTAAASHRIRTLRLFCLKRVLAIDLQSSNKHRPAPTNTTTSSKLVGTDNFLRTGYRQIGTTNTDILRHRFSHCGCKQQKAFGNLFFLMSNVMEIFTGVIDVGVRPSLLKRFASNCRF